VGGFKRLGDLFRDSERLHDRNLSSGDPLVQALALNEFEHEKLGVVGFNEVVNLSDVRMIERGENLRLASEASDSVRIVGDGGRQNL
jgi:hypothetical protein